MSEEIKLAEILYTTLTGTVIPVVILWLQRVSWPAHYKFGLAAALSVIAATLMSIIDGTLTPTNMVSNFVNIFTVSQTVYFTFFRALNLHAFFYPQDALANKAKDAITQSIEHAVAKEDAAKILDSNEPDELVVSINIEKTEG